MIKEPETYGDLKRLLARATEGDYPSRVNPSLTHSQALDILRKGLASQADETPLDGTRHGTLYRRNALRECKERA